jgi:tetrahydromethanopterin S-methyltransferase subunit G
MKKEGIDIGPLFVMIIGFLLGMVIISLTSCDKTLSKDSKYHSTNVG